MPTYTPFPVWPAPEGGEGGGVTSHGALTGRSSADQHPIDAITGLDAALAAGSEFTFVAIAVSDENEGIDFDDGSIADPSPIPRVLVFNRGDSTNGVYSVSMADGWTLLDDQPTIVVAESVVLWDTLAPVVAEGIFSLFVDNGVGLLPVGLLPSFATNPTQVFGHDGWRTLPVGTFTYFTDGDGGYDIVGGPYVTGAARIFIGPDDPDTAGFTMADGDQWEDTTP